MKACKFFLVLSVSFCCLLVIEPADALDLRKVTKDLHYECHTEIAAGLYKDPKSGKIEATVFKADPSDRWEMKLVKVNSQEDLEKVPYACGRQRSKRDGSFPNLFYADFPEFCKMVTLPSEGQALVHVEHCKLTARASSKESYNAIACGLEDSTFFDSDRLFGIQGPSSIAFFGEQSAKLFKSASVSKFVCQRLDR